MAEREQPLEQVAAWASDYSQNALSAYIEALTHRQLVSDTREVNDPIWATISLTPFETVIVDSPLFQRLRRIRQLGVVHWVYPGCVHTRFEHSLGALHQIQELIDAINRDTADQQSTIDAERAALLRFCALCHDLGHGAMSHVLETAVSTFEAVEDIRLAFGKTYDTQPPLSEILAYYLIGSPAFRQMLQQARTITKGPHPPQDAVDRAQKAITGRLVYEDMPLFQELISGPFDADKLDYMQRDAVMAGIPAITDVPRLVRKVRARWVGRMDLPSRVTKWVGQAQRCLIFGIAFSGSRTLDELLIARVLLFDKVYRHQKVRALEGMIARLISALALVYKGPVFQIPFLFVDDTLLEADRLLPSRDDFDCSKAKQDTLLVIADICSRLRERRLFVRAFVFSMHFPEFDNDRAAHRGMDKFVADVEGAGLNDLLEIITSEIRAVASVLNEPLADLADRTLRSYVWLDPSTKRDHSEKVSNAFLLKKNSTLIRYSEHSKEVPRWAQAYLAKKDVGFLFCIPELQLFAFLALEKILAEGKYMLRVPESSLAYLNLDDKAIASARDRLHDDGYYKAVPFTTRPWRSLLKGAAVEQGCNAVRQTLREYIGPPGEGDNQRNYLTSERIKLWASQFEEQPLVAHAIRVAEKIKIIGRTDFSAAVNQFTGENVEFRNGVVVPLGDPKDSGSVVAYFTQDTGLESVDLDRALSENRPVIFVDDCIGSGGQSENILRDWFGEPKQSALGEDRRQKLSTEQQATLRKLPVAFVFSNGLSVGACRLRELCAEYSINARVHLQLTETDVPTLFDNDLQTYESHSVFVERCKAISRDLFKQTHPDWNQTKIEERLLGYGNKGLLVTFPYNTPSQTLTCVWSRGTWRGLPWTPLLIRRLKK